MLLYRTGSGRLRAEPASDPDSDHTAPGFIDADRFVGAPDFDRYPNPSPAHYDPHCFANLHLDTYAYADLDSHRHVHAYPHLHFESKPYHDSNCHLDADPYSLLHPHLDANHHADQYSHRA